MDVSSGFIKISTLASSAAFDAQLNLERITTQIIGIVIIIIRAVLTVCLLVAISSYISVTSHRKNSSEQPLICRGVSGTSIKLKGQ